jgi:hypothetical protein
MTMQDKRKRGGINWSSLIGWLIFLLVIAGAPLYNMLRQALGSTTALPANIIPILIGGLVALSVLVSAVRALGNSNRSNGNTRLPTSMSPPMRTPNTAMPPFGGSSQRPALPQAPPRAFTMPPSSRPIDQPTAPRFEPVLNPTIVALAVLGLLVLGGAALFLGLGSIP